MPRELVIPFMGIAIAVFGTVLLVLDSMGKDRKSR